MGILADQFAATLAAMREADERQQAATAAILANVRQTLATLDAEPITTAQQIADAIELLESHGYRVTR
jgi:hypothetical protein